MQTKYIHLWLKSVELFGTVKIRSDTSDMCENILTLGEGITAKNRFQGVPRREFPSIILVI